VCGAVYTTAIKDAERKKPFFLFIIYYYFIIIIIIIILSLCSQCCRSKARQKRFPQIGSGNSARGVRKSEKKGGAYHHETVGIFSPRDTQLRSVFSSPFRLLQHVQSFFLGRHVAWRPLRSYLFKLIVCVYFVCVRVLNCWSPRRDLLSGSHFDLCRDARLGSHCVCLSSRFPVYARVICVYWQATSRPVYKYIDLT
jgi:hypothetical protein